MFQGQSFVLVVPVPDVVWNSVEITFFYLRKQYIRLFLLCGGKNYLNSLGKNLNSQCSFNPLIMSILLIDGTVGLEKKLLVLWSNISINCSSNLAVEHLSTF